MVRNRLAHVDMIAAVRQTVDTFAAQPMRLLLVATDFRIVVHRPTTLAAATVEGRQHLAGALHCGCRKASVRRVELAMAAGHLRL